MLFRSGNWEYTPSGDETVTVTVRCTDDCGEYCEDTFVITFDINEAPVCTVPEDQTFFQCTPTMVSLPVSATDGDDNLTGCTIMSGPGMLNGSNWEYTPSGDETVTVTVRCTDDCGEYCEDTFVITFDINEAPVCQVPADTVIFQCDPAEVSLPFSATDADDNLDSCTIDQGPGGLAGGAWYYTPIGNDTVSVTIKCFDECGATCSETFTVIFDINDQPICETIGPDQFFLCADSTFAYVVSATDYDDNIASAIQVSGQGVFNPDGNVWTVTTAGTGTYAAGIAFTDECGEVCTSSVSIDVTLNSAPVCELPGDTTVFLCESAEVCLPVSASDVDDNLVSCEVVDGKGGIESGEWCYTPTENETIDITVRCTDECGAICEETFTITFDLNESPVCNIPEDAEFFVCDDTTFNFTVSATDGDDNLSECIKLSGPGTFDGSTWTFNAGSSGEYSATFECVDECGASCVGTVNITVEMNEPPVCVVEDYTVIGQCEPTEANVSVYGEDPDNNLASCTLVSGPGTLNGVFWTYTPSGDEVVDLTVVCTDECGATCQKDFSVEFVIDEIYCIPALVTIEKTHDAYQGQNEEVRITIENNPIEMGGFDFLISYDASALTPVEVLPGQFINDCGWEYFTYRFGVTGNCDGPCPSGMLRVVALAELNNGPHHPTCYTPASSGQTELAILKFYVTNDRTYECQYAPVKFFWMDCGDNAISNVEGDVLYIDRVVYDFEGGVVWDEFDDLQFPEADRVEGIGAPDSCLNPNPDKPSSIRFLEFKWGGVDIVCADSIDARGDLNLNNLANEIADGVLYTNYFVSGLSVFDINVEGQIAASDVNADGRPLTVGDLVYLTRIITGDALPFNKLSPFSMSSDLIVTRETGSLELATDASVDLGAVYLVFDIGDATAPVKAELASQIEDMSLKSAVVDGQLRLLISNLGSGRIESGLNQLVSIETLTELELVHSEIVDYQGNELRVATKDRILPTRFELAQNFPNPFNPETEITLFMPETSDWKLTIYNIAGQQIRSFEGTDPAGEVVVRWNGLDQSGREVASGIYFYKATAGKFSETKKMVLMK